MQIINVIKRMYGDPSAYIPGQKENSTKKVAAKQQADYTRPATATANTYATTTSATAYADHY